MPQAQPKKVAQPRPAPPPRPAALVVDKVYSTKDQEAFNAEADALAASLGWSGPADNELNGISVGDAQGFLCKVFHEIHQDATHPSELDANAKPDQVKAELDADKVKHTAAIVEHLGLTDTDEVKLVTDAVWAAYERECAAAPANPTAVATNPRVANIAAKLEADASALIGIKGVK